MGAYNDDVLFIHIPKTGGTAVKAYMHGCDPSLKWPRTYKHFMRRGFAEAEAKDMEAGAVQESGLPIGHIPLRDIPKYTGRALDSWRVIIAALRNPYAQQVSQWEFWRKRYAKGQRHPSDSWAASCPDMTAWLQGPMCDFHLQYEDRYHQDAPWQTKGTPMDGYAGFGGYYRYWIADESGEIPPNVRLIRQEELGPQFIEASGMTGAEFRVVNSHGGKGNVMEYYQHPTQPGLALDLVEAKFAFTWAQGFYDKAVRV